MDELGPRSVMLMLANVDRQKQFRDADKYALSTNNDSFCL